MAGGSFQMLGYSNEEAALMNKLMKVISVFEFDLKKINGKWKITSTYLPNMSLLEGMDMQQLLSLKKPVY